jgi:hypothetical protein
MSTAPFRYAIKVARIAMLVVSGPEARHVWHDARADQARLYPVAIATKKLDWYMHSLHGALAMLPNRRA